jgi:hypothetical protein
MKRPPSFPREVLPNPLPIEGGKSGDDIIFKFNDFVFHYPSPGLHPQGERGKVLK